MTDARSDFIQVDYPEPHPARTRDIIQAHPEVRDLFGSYPVTAWYTVGIVALQIAVALLLNRSPWWLILLVAYCVGAFANHALYVVIHECTHNLVFKKTLPNRLLALFANLPQIFPGSMSFLKYHLLHHRYQGEPDLDADLPGPTEARLIGNRTPRKALFLFLFPLVLGVVRPLRLKKVQLFDRWFILNLLLQFGFIALLFYGDAGRAFFYLMISTVFGIGLHPLGARWIQEHYIMKENQETYSYYGPLNKVCMNVGYHNEHHDFMRVSWPRLPKVRALAPEFYDSLHSYRSWTALLLKFLFDPTIGLHHRVVRSDAPNRS